jgi:hypothetical protein
VSVFFCVRAVVQEGFYGVGHDQWHMKFYLTLKRNDGGGSCCNLMDCRPTQSRMVGDHYEVKVDGEWTPVPNPNSADAGADMTPCWLWAVSATSRPYGTRAYKRPDEVSTPSKSLASLRSRVSKPSLNQP